MLRFPDGMRALIKELAEKNGRTMNAEIVHVLQSYLNQRDEQADRLQEGLTTEEQTGISLGLTSPLDRAAVLKVLLLQELMLLKSRVSQLGGRDVVLKASKAEIAQRIEGPRLKGTEEERKSYFSRIVGETPLTALLTDDEIERLASRVVSIQGEHERHTTPKKS